ncbi:MAG: 1-phosphofructokinase [Oscillospiraceae bacterium]|nr:1-phosphofructokinase [Oscillospiraceae bacterium]
MIATVTMNPAVDYTVLLEEPLVRDSVNRTSHERITAGGKGVNVSLILQQLQIPTTVYGYLSGTTGTMIAEQLQRTQIPTDWTVLPNQMNRINVKVKDHEAVTELNGRGIVVSAGDTELLLNKLRKYGPDDFIVLAGSVPAGAPATHYADVMRALADTGVRFAVDAEGEALCEALAQHPFVVKPNLREMCSVFGIDPVETWWDALPYGQKMIDMGAQNVLLSLGAGGALLFNEQKRVWHLSAPRGEVKNAVGSGDSMLGGFLAGCASGKELTESLRMGIAAGSATAFSEWIATRSRMENLLKTLPYPTELL